MSELRTLGFLMKKCSPHRRTRRGPAVGSRPPARNNNTAEVNPLSGARPAAGGAFSQRTLLAGLGGWGTARALRAPLDLGGRGRDGAV